MVSFVTKDCAKKFEQPQTPAYKVREISNTCSFDDEPDIATRGTGGTHRITHVGCYWSVLSIAMQVVKNSLVPFPACFFLLKISRNSETPCND